MTITALVHIQCGHVAHTATSQSARDVLYLDADVMGPRWEVATLDVDDAVDRVLDGVCRVCLVDLIP